MNQSFLGFPKQQFFFYLHYSDSFYYGIDSNGRSFCHRLCCSHELLRLLERTACPPTTEEWEFEFSYVSSHGFPIQIRQEQ